MNDVLQSKLVKRNVPLKALTYANIEQAAGSTVRQRITMQQGIPIEKARDIVKAIKNSKKKVQAAIQGDLVRVSGKDRDTLQDIIATAQATGFRHRHAVYELPQQLNSETSGSPRRHGVHGVFLSFAMVFRIFLL